MLNNPTYIYSTYLMVVLFLENLNLRAARKTRKLNILQIVDAFRIINLFSNQQSWWWVVYPKRVGYLLNILHIFGAIRNEKSSTFLKTMRFSMFYVIDSIHEKRLKLYSHCIVLYCLIVTFKSSSNYTIILLIVVYLFIR